MCETRRQKGHTHAHISAGARVSQVSVKKTKDEEEASLFLPSASGLLGVCLGGSIIQNDNDYASTCEAWKVGF